uniref:40S ribosomal protein S15a n=1 Tax=Naja naja TaxID=35670 RepID=A0A8C6X1X9_NAJNA
MVISNAEKHGKHQLGSRIIVWFLTMTMKHGYIGEFGITDDHRVGKTVVNLTHWLNKDGVISPRFNVQPKGLQKWYNNLLPSHQFVMILSRGGIQQETKQKHTEGKILGFFF